MQQFNMRLAIQRAATFFYFSSTIKPLHFEHETKGRKKTKKKQKIVLSIDPFVQYDNQQEFRQKENGRETLSERTLPDSIDKFPEMHNVFYFNFRQNKKAMNRGLSFFSLPSSFEWFDPLKKKCATQEIRNSFFFFFSIFGWIVGETLSSHLKNAAALNPTLETHFPSGKKREYPTILDSLDVKVVLFVI